MRWRNPKEELPKAGEMVWVLTMHKDSPESIAIYCGQVSYSRDGSSVVVDNFDGIGQGGIWWQLKGEETDLYNDEAEFWLPLREMTLPREVVKRVVG